MNPRINGMGLSAIVLSCTLFIESVVPGLVRAAEIWEREGGLTIESSLFFVPEGEEMQSLVDTIDPEEIDREEVVLQIPGGGPDQPEVQSFTPIGTSDLVSPFTGDFSYNIPLLEVDGYPINIAYNAGVTMDQEASWVGLGWNLNPGVVSRSMRGIPDDFNGSETVKKEFNMKPNWTAGTSVGVGLELAGFDIGSLGLSASLGVNYNNYNGFGANVSIGPSFTVAKAGGSSSLTASLGFSGSSQGGASVSPGLSFSQKQKGTGGKGSVTNGINIGTSLNSRGGVSNVNVGYSRSVKRWTVQPGFFFPRINSSTVSASTSASFNTGMSTYTPQITMPTRSFSFTGNFKLSPDATTSDPSVDFSGFYSRTWLKNKTKNVPAYGYMNAQLGQWNDQAMMDFNRENDGQFTKNTPTLPNTALTYDIYSISGQGVGGSYRPYRPDIGYVFDPAMKTTSVSASVGAELGFGLTFKAGIDVSGTYLESKSGPWNQAQNGATQGARFSSSKLYFREANEMSVDSDPSHFANIGGDQAVRFNNNSIASAQNVLENNANTPISAYSSHVKSGEEKRNQVVYTLTNGEVKQGLGIQPLPATAYANTNAPDHHIGQFTTLNIEGARYVYGIAAYNKKQINASFAIGASTGGPGNSEICGEGRVAYSSTDASVNNSRGQDNHFNSVELPGFAHSYLLTSVLNADYIDADDIKGPSKGDLGGYMTFSYQPINNYKWRNPVNSNEAFFDEGLNGDNSDDKAHYIYGEKELWYLDTIKTKNHIAIFFTSNRSDGYEVLGENGGVNTSGNAMQKLDKIELYSLPEYEANPSGSVPLKVVHFEYDYTLCPGYDQNQDGGTAGGKLTLKKVYFTYQGSNKGKYTPYTFDYSAFNPQYDMKNVDRWGCYKANTAGCGAINIEPLRPSDYPYVGYNKAQVDTWVSAWNLSTINLPSGGRIEVDYEADEYSHVQHKRAGQMFKIVGVQALNASDAVDATYPSINVATNGQAAVSTSSLKNSRIYFELPPIPNFVGTPTIADYNINDYVAGLDKAYFRALMDLDGRYDFVPGYGDIGSAPAPYITSLNGQIVGCLPYIGEKLNDNGGSDYNPMSVAAVQFARLHLSRYMPPSNQGNIDDGLSLLDILTALAGAFTSFEELFTGANKALWNDGIGQDLVLNHSWVRLNNPYGNKLGGGHRVKEIRMYDAWDALSGAPDEFFYGQEYNYNLDNGTSSGVAAYEPQIGGDENVWRQPIANNTSYTLAPDARNYQETPFGEQFFPGPRVGYSKVTIEELNRTNVTRTATGKTVKEFYTAKDFPTITRRTSPQIERFKLPIFAIFFSMSIDEMSASQGFVIENNDMHGKPKAETVYAEGQSEPISKVEYFYQSESIVVDGIAARHLVNTVTTINKDGTVSNNTIGRVYEGVADFRKATSNMVGGSVNVNLNYTIPFILVPMVLGSGSFERTAFKSATFTKIIERFGIMSSTRATDLGSVIETNNLAYDAETGNVLLTQTTTDFNDKIYNFTYPAHWYYDGMGQAYRNIGYRVGSATFSAGIAAGSFTSPFSVGDEVGFYLAGTPTLGWVTSKNNSAIEVLLKDGTPLNGAVTGLKILRSGRRNLQSTSVGSVALRTNPLIGLTSNVFEKVLQAGTVEYEDEWRTFCECFLDENNDLFTSNPYVLGLKGTWRPKASYVHLAGRTQAFANNNSDIRDDGIFTSYTPFYKLTGGLWSIDKTNWTSTSSVVEFSPFGQALETIDVLDRYSSSQYGYNQTFAIAMAQNTRYRQLGYDGFEDYSYDNCSDNHFRLGVGGNIDDTESHTGRRSIRVTPASPVVFSTILNIDCEPEGCMKVIRTIATTNCPKGCSNPHIVNATFNPTEGTAPYQFDSQISSGTPVITIINGVLTITNPSQEAIYVTITITDANGCTEVYIINQ